MIGFGVSIALIVVAVLIYLAVSVIRDFRNLDQWEP